MVTITKIELVPYEFINDPCTEKVSDRKAIPGIDTIRPAYRHKIKSSEVPEERVWDLTGCGVEELRYDEQILGNISRDFKVFPTSKMSIQQVEEKYNPSKATIRGMPAETEYPLPAGTPFFMKYLVPNTPDTYVYRKSIRSDVVGTASISSEDVQKIRGTMRTYEATKVIPRLGRSILRETASRLGFLQVPARDADGKLQLKDVKCDECGGKFKKDGYGDYVCTGCGIIHERSIEVVDEVPEMVSLTDDDAYQAYYESDENIPEVNVCTIRELEIGGTLPPEMARVESRLISREIAWKKSLEVVPNDEVAAKLKAAEDKVRSDKAKEAFKKLIGHTVYESKWDNKRLDYFKYQIVILAKLNPGISTSEIRSMARLDSNTKTFYNLLNSLESMGRIRIDKKGKTSVVVFLK
jgi:hypothetical protein